MIEWALHLTEPVLGQPDVNGRGVETLVPQQGLHRLESRSVFDEVSCESVTERAWSHALDDAGLLAGRLKRALDAGCGPGDGR